MSNTVFRLHARIVKTLDPLALRDLLLLSCTTTTTTASLSYTRAVFLDHCPSIRHTFPWNTIIRAHVQIDPPEALSLFSAMRLRGISPDCYTFPFVLKACCRHPSPRLGFQIGLGVHAVLIQLGFGSHLHVGNAVVSFYGGLGFVDLAVQAFDEMLDRDTVSWSAIISCFVSNRLDDDALATFQSMQLAGVAGSGEVEADEVTMVSVVTAVGNLATPQLAIWVYSYIFRKGLALTVSLGTALVVMLSKCGFINCATQLFDRMPVRNASTWTALIIGLADHGKSRQAVRIFNQMVEEGFLPDQITFIGILTACSHGGLLEEGMRLFDSIERVHRLVPWMEHYGCMVDLLGRARRLDDAHEFIKKMPIRPGAVIWRTLLGACVNHGNVELAEHVKRKIMELEPGHDGDYVLLSNAFGQGGRWSERAGLMVQIKDRSIVKTPGWSVPYQ